MTKTGFDVIIIGAGLSGLTAGIELQRKGKRICILERLDRVGGLCGTHNIDGYEFVVACNDFGTGMQKMFNRFDIEQEFHKPRTKVFYKGNFYYTDVGFADLFKGWRYSLQIIRYLLKAFLPSLCHREELYLEGLVNKTVKNQTLNDMLKLPAYLMGVKPSEFKTSMFREDIKFGYGYLTPTTPVGGPQAMVNKMAEKFLQKGEIHLKTEVLDVKSDRQVKRVITSSGELQANHVINCTSKVSDKADLKEGLPISSYCLVVSKLLEYPQNIHTMVYYPPNPEEWFGQLDRGEFVSDFGFHIFCSDLQAGDNYSTANVYFYLPRGVNELSEENLKVIDQHIFSSLEKMLPGINDAIMYKRFISPREFEQRHGLSSRVTPLITTQGVGKPPNYNNEEDIFYAGNSHFPPGDHAGAAILSGLVVAEQVIKAPRPVYET